MDDGVPMTTIADYHQRTKHSMASLRANQHVLDWENQPLPFKIYEDVPALPLPRDLASGGAALDLRELARLLHFSAGITKRKQYPGGGTMYFRAAACTGALYHIDVYVVCGTLPGLEAGVYHFGPHDGALRRLRGGDFRGALVAASGDEPAVAAAPALLVCTSTFWRNAWKYQARTYRHCFWDNGTLLANLLAVAAADGVAARVVVGFVDAAVNGLLDLDPEREVALSVVALGGGGVPPPPSPPLPRLGLATRPLSPRQVDYPLIRAAHAATSLADAGAVRDWRRRAQATPPPAAANGERVALPVSLPPLRSIEETIRRRGSARRFARAPIAAGALAALLRDATAGVALDAVATDGLGLAEPYLIVNAADGIAAGSYAYDARAGELVRIAAGDFRRVAGHLDLGQELAADAALNLYLLADLERILAAQGPRGYRAAQLEAAIAGGRLYLAAYARQLGATGLTFFDDDVVEFFSPPAADGVMFLAAAGKRG